MVAERPENRNIAGAGDSIIVHRNMQIYPQACRPSHKCTPLGVSRIRP